MWAFRHGSCLSPIAKPGAAQAATLDSRLLAIERMGWALSDGGTSKSARDEAKGLVTPYLLNPSAKTEYISCTRVREVSVNTFKYLAHFRIVESRPAARRLRWWCSGRGYSQDLG